MLKAQNRMHPGAPTDALNTEAFAAKLLGSLETRIADHRMRKLAGDRRKNSNIETLGRRYAQTPMYRRLTDLEIPGDKTRHQDGRAP